MSAVTARPGVVSKPGGAERTRDLMRRHGHVLAYGSQHRILLRQFYRDPDGPFPEFAERGEGYELWDTNGRRFIDWLNGWGPVLLGYRHPAVEDAIVDQLRAGSLLSLMHPLEIEVAESLARIVPCAEMVAFGKNGSDVVTAAVRLARAVTGREVILQHGVHGFHDWYTCLHPGVQGIPSVLRDYVEPFPYNDLEALERLFERFDGKVAAVVMEPTSTQLPHEGYLEGVRELAQENGALLVFDEMITGFRLANGGAQELFRVTPDLACFGKAIANGMPLSAIAGKREHMLRLPSVGFGMTFRGETLSLAAARAVIHTLETEPVIEHLARIGSELRGGFADLCTQENLLCDTLGPEARTTFAFHDQGGISRDDISLGFVLECARRGVLTNGSVLPSYAHDDEAVEQSLEVFGEVLHLIGDAVRSGREQLRSAVRESFLVGTGADQPEGGQVTTLPHGSIDVVRAEGGALELIGWMLLPDGWPDVVEFRPPSGEPEVAEVVRRPDLAEAFPGLAGSENGGFSVRLPAERFARDGAYGFTMQARRGADTVFHCEVRGRGSNRSSLDPPCWDGRVLLV
jgi:glutamate-1-semialdehyde aminotransferase